MSSISGFKRQSERKRNESIFQRIGQLMATVINYLDAIVTRQKAIEEGQELLHANLLAIRSHMGIELPESGDTGGTPVVVTTDPETGEVVLSDGTPVAEVYPEASEVADETTSSLVD